MTMISAIELKERKEEDNLLLIDVRECWEYDENNIGAKNIPLAEIPNKLNELESFKSREIVVHCQSGRRSNQAQKYLSKHGFENVRSLDGGIVAYLELEV